MPSIGRGSDGADKFEWDQMDVGSNGWDQTWMGSDGREQVGTDQTGGIEYMGQNGFDQVLTEPRMTVSNE